MINAHQARDLVGGSKQMVQEHLQKLDIKVREAAGKGQQRIEYSYPLEEMTIPLIKALEELDYKACQLHSNGIEIKW